MVSFLVSFSGLFLVEDDFVGPFARAGGMDDDFHEALAQLLLFLVVVHVLAAILMSLLEGENLIRAMWTGQKSAPEAEAPSEPVAVAGSRWLAVLAAIVAGFLALWPFL